MPKVAILIAASATPAFYSQIGILNLALRKLPWSRWRPRVHVYIGGSRDVDADNEWLPRLNDLEMIWVPWERFEREGDWAQSDDVFRFAPSDADVLLAMDADTFPVADLECVLDRVLETGSIAGVIAHYPFPRFPETSVREAWADVARGLVDVSLNFAFAHTLMGPDIPPAHRLTPFYLNFGFVLFPGAAFEEVAWRYLAIRPNLMDRMPDPDFSGQAALTLAINAAGARTRALPVRYNFPNDPIAAAMHPTELANVAVFHYLRTSTFDRQRIFANAQEYAQFLALPLTGVDLAFQQSVKKIIGPEYPFT